MYPGSHVADHGDHAAVIWAPTGVVTTFAELDAAANRLARLLRSLGVAPGDHVAICMENHPRYLEVLWGCHYAGTVYTAASSRLTSGELAYVVGDCGATVFVTTRHLAESAPAPDRDTFARELAASFDREIDRWRQFGLDPLFARLLAASYPLGSVLTVHGADGTWLTGEFCGLESDGALRLRLSDGTVSTVHAGDITEGRG